MGSILCEHCTGHCCKYVALPIDTPDTRRDFDDIRWYLLHENVLVFVEDGDWYVQFNTRCRHLQPDHRCSTYDTRPRICREYSTDECEYHAGEYEYEQLFTEPEQLDAYVARELGAEPSRPRKRRTAARKRRPRRGVRPGAANAPTVPLTLPSGATV
jgi:Fe-S-cluster containining protein